METRILKAGKEAYEEAGSVLKSGGIAAFPTDTVYGLGAVFSDREAVRKIFKAKGRSEGKPLSVLISDINQVSLLSDCVTDGARRVMERFWPGALTVILKKSSSVPEEVSAGGETVGIRMPGSEAASKIIEAAGAPLAAPSANISGKRSAACAGDVLDDLAGRIDLIIDGGQCGSGISSTVIDISEGALKVLREGEITKEEIEQVYGTGDQIQ